MLDTTKPTSDFLLSTVTPAIFKLFRTFACAGGDVANHFTGASVPYLPPVKDPILVMPTQELAEKIRKRQLTSESIVRAFINRARLVQGYLNAIIDDRYDQAIEDAKAIDEFLKTCTLTENELADQKPFLGIPFTVKDSVQVTGMKWTSGSVVRKDMVATEDAPVVRNLRKSGAIPIAITNVPELLLWMASSNKLYGATNNPFDSSRVPGGSSGGEGALVTSCGSPLSVCNDIGGSIRMPAFHCGLFGHKPTHKVIPWQGTFPVIEDRLEDLFSFGPVSRFADDLIPAIKAMAGENKHLFVDLDKPVDLTKIRVFYIDESEDEMSAKVEPYIRESINKAAQHFGQKFGVPVEKAKLNYFKHVGLWYSLLFANEQEVSKLLTGNTHKINPFLELCKSLIGQSNYSPSALTAAAAQETARATCGPNKGAVSLYSATQELLEKSRAEFNSLLGDDGVFIYVTLPHTAVSHYASFFEFPNVCCPMVMNYLGVPATQVPAGINEGLPYGFQVAASPFNDRLTLAVAKELESVFGGWVKPCAIEVDSESQRTT